MNTLQTLLGKSLFVRKTDRSDTVIQLPDRSGESGRAGQASLTTGPRTGSLRKRLAVLAALIAVPAMAAPGDFGAMPGAAPTEAEIVNARLAKQMAQNPPMDFERPGMSFPGSAFFFLADPPSTGSLVALPTTDATDPGAEAGRELGQLIDAGPAARPFFSSGGLSHERALDCLAQAVWYEAASESEAGQRAVAQVVLNRVAHPSWPGSVCGVVYQGSQRSTGCQFTFTCDGSLARKARGTTWVKARRVAQEALSGSVYAPVGHATHYHTLWVNPYWASSLEHVGTIGAHRFYRNRGAAGDKAAFTGRYGGFEPGVSGRIAPGDVTSVSLPGLPDAAPVPGSARGGGSNPESAAGLASPRPSQSAQPVGPEPILADRAYSGVGQVREGYASAGQWKSDAARAALQADETALAQERAEGPAGPANGSGPAPQR